jgi:alkanesulfonate monooxygenase SsuD/methylene tetrahydromethanopterin reductase-like flavin-dependent oxidoreductase (luciferase family)
VRTAAQGGQVTAPNPTDRRVLFGLGLDATTDHAGTLLRQAEQADRAGLDLVTVADHPWNARELDAYAALGMILGRTGAVSAAVNVTNLPNRPAPVLARTLSTLSTLSGGRVVFGIGAGGSYPAIRALGLEPLGPAAAVRAMEEAIHVVRALTGGGEPVSVTGEHFRLDRMVPADAPTPPIWTGSVGPRSLAVTGRLADGWIPGHGADWLSARVAESRPVVDAAAVAAGRDPADVRTVHNLPGRITADPLPATRDGEGRWIGGSVGQWVEELTSAVLEHRAGGFLLFPVDDGTPAEVVAGRWAEEVAPAVREAVGITEAAVSAG